MCELLVFTKLLDMNVWPKLLQDGTNVTNENNGDIWNDLILHFTERDNGKHLRYYLQNGGDSNIVDKNGTTLLMVAAQRDLVEHFLILIVHNPRYFIRDRNNWNALHHAAKSGSERIVSILATMVNSFYDLNNITTKESWTALMTAIHSNSTRTVRTLIEHGSHMLMTDNLGQTVYEQINQPENQAMYRTITHPTILYWNYMQMDDIGFEAKLNELDVDFKCSVLLLNNNCLTYLPDLNKYPQFSSLKVLNVNVNDIQELKEDCIPHSVDKFYFSQNRIKTISGSLYKLAAPDAIKCGFFCHKNILIEEIPDLSDIKEMQHIRVLLLHRNQIQVIHGLPSNLEYIRLDLNPICVLHPNCFPSGRVYKVLVKALSADQVSTLQQPPPQIFQRGYKAVKLYFKDIEWTQTVLNSKNRLALIGESTAGKSSLLQSLINNSPQLTRIEDRTQVVDVKPWQITDHDMYLIFDQGGNVIYTITNPLFVSKECTVLVVHDLSNNDKNYLSKTLNVYKRTVQQHPDISMHFVLTHIDMLDSETIPELHTIFKSSFIDLLDKEITTLTRMQIAAKINTTQIDINLVESLLASYTNKKVNTKFFTVSSLTFEGMPELRQFLIESLSGKQVVLPKKWINTFKELMQNQSNFLTLAEFEKIFSSTYTTLGKLMAVIQRKSVKERAENCLHYFKDTGLVLWYPENEALRNFVFYSLEFLINIFKALFHHDLLGSLNYAENTTLQTLFNEVEFQQAISQYQQQGLLGYKLLVYLWDRYNLKSADKAALIELMKRFNLCHEIHEGRTLKRREDQLFFYPWFVKDNHPPSSLDHLKERKLQKENLFSLEIECLFHNSIPINISEMFIVRLQRYAVEHNYLGKRYAWSDGLYVTVGDMECYVMRKPENFSIVFNTKGDVQNLVEMWLTMNEMHQALQSILAQWNGVVKSMHVTCPHCMIKEKENPQKWCLAQVFPEHPKKTPIFVSCNNETIPAGLVTMVACDSDRKKHIQAVTEYLKQAQRECYVSDASNKDFENNNTIYDRLLQEHSKFLVDHLDPNINIDLYSKGIINLQVFQQISQRIEHEGTIVAVTFLVQALNGKLNETNFSTFLDCLKNDGISTRLEESLKIFQ